MKNIYEDGRDVPDEISENEITTQETDEPSAAEASRRRQFRSAEERRLKREQRLESTAARRAEKEAQREQTAQSQPLPHQSAQSFFEQHTVQPPVYTQPPVTQTLTAENSAHSDVPLTTTPQGVVSVTPQYFIQQTPGQPPQLFVSQQTAQPTVQSAASGAIYRSVDTKPKAISSAPNTTGMKIVYQSPDFDSPRSSLPQSADETVEHNEIQPPVQPKVQKPAYSAGAYYEQNIIKKGRHPVLNSETLEYSEPVEAKPQRKRFVVERQIEEVPLDTVKRTASLKTDDEPVPEIQDEAVAQQPEPSKEKNSKDRMYDTIRRIVLAVAIIVAAGSVTYLVREWKLSVDSKKLEAELSALAPAEEEDDGNAETESKAPETTLTPEEMFAKLRTENPNINYPAGIQAKYAEYYTINQDFVGYLSIPGMDIGMPVVQCDNDSDYLKLNFYKKSTKYGCPFLTHTNNIEPLDQNTIIFGHNMKNGTVFAPLVKYQKLEGYKSAPVITFNTIYHDYKWKVISVFLTNSELADDNGKIFEYYFAATSQKNFTDYLAAIKSRSLYSTGVDVLPTDKLLTLSTCAYDFDDARLVVVARLVRTGESDEVDVSKAQLNPNPRYPQAYYDKKGKTNPYADVTDWVYGQ